MKERNYGIDLLRLVLMFMVCILHTLGAGGILDACGLNTVEYKVYWFFEILSYCAVDSFAIISGYTATGKPRKYEKLVDMWFQVFFYSFIITITLTIIGINDNLGFSDIRRSLLPVTYKYYWYFSAFFALFFAIPVLNTFLFTLEQNTAKKVFIILVALFSMCVLYDCFNLQSGYSALWIIVLYCIGVLAKIIKLFENKKSLTLILLWAICILSTWSLKIFFDSDRLLNYISPTILFSGLIMVILFSRLHLSGKLISKLSPLAFGIYLFHSNEVIWTNAIVDRFSFIASKHIAIGIAYVFVSAFIIFISGMIVEYIRSKCAKALRISLLSKKIVSFIDSMIVKLFGLLH